MARAGKMIFLSERGGDKNDGLTAEVTARVRALQKQVQEELSAWAKVVPHKTPKSRKVRSGMTRSVS